jgi:lipopolysaccharide transport system ATP-binding protein
MVEYVGVGEEVTLKVQVAVRQEISQLVLGYVIKDRLGQEIFGTNTYHHDAIVSNAVPGENIEFSFSFPANLGVGSYSVSLAAHSHDTHLSKNYEWRDQALIFNVLNVDKKEFVGLAWIEPKIEVKYVN